MVLILKKVQVTQNAMLRNLLGLKLKDKVSITKLFEKTKVRRAGVVARTLKYKYVGHMVRDVNYKWNKILSFWLPHWGKRKKGRPCTR